MLLLEAAEPLSSVISAMIEDVVEERCKSNWSFPHITLRPSNRGLPMEEWRGHIENISSLSSSMVAIMSRGSRFAALAVLEVRQMPPCCKRVTGGPFSFHHGCPGSAMGNKESGRAILGTSFTATCLCYASSFQLELLPNLVLPGCETHLTPWRRPSC